MPGDQLRRVESVLRTMTQMVAADGGEVRLVSFEPEASRLVVDYDRGPKGGCSACVLEPASLKDFIAEALESRGLALQDVVVRSEPGETAP